MSRAHQRGPATEFARVDLVDNWHKDWEKVLTAVGTYGDRASLHVDADGWLPARQNLLVAFVDDRPAAHVCFHVEPAPAEHPKARNGHGARPKRGCVEAQLDSYGIDPKFCGHGIEHALRKAALERASTLQCRKLHGFDLTEKWC